MSDTDIDRALKKIQILALFQLRQLRSGCLDMDDLERSLKLINNKAATALDRKDLVIR